jgi:predicted DNA-binding protein with PD1-like motif
MAVMKRIKPREVFIGKLSHGGDLLEEFTDICKKENIQLGWIEALGSVQRARLGFYNQETHEYEFFVVDQPLEITKLVGNISLKGDSLICPCTHHVGGQERECVWGSYRTRNGGFCM